MTFLSVGICLLTLMGLFKPQIGFFQGLLEILRIFNYGRKLISCQVHHKVLIAPVRCVHSWQMTTKFLDVCSRKMFPIIQEEWHLTYGHIHSIVHPKHCRGQHLIPSALIIPGKCSNVIFKCHPHCLYLTIHQWMIRRTHFLLHSPLFCAQRKNAHMNLMSLSAMRSVWSPWHLKTWLMWRFAIALTEKSIFSGASPTIFVSWSTKTTIIVWPWVVSVSSMIKSMLMLYHLCCGTSRGCNNPTELLYWYFTWRYMSHVHTHSMMFCFILGY